MDKWRFGHLLDELRREKKIESDAHFAKLMGKPNTEISKFRKHTGCSEDFDDKIIERFPEYKDYILRNTSTLDDAREKLEHAIREVAFWGEYILKRS